METKKYKNEAELEEDIYRTLMDAGDLTEESTPKEEEEAIKVTREDWETKFEIIFEE